MKRLHLSLSIMKYFNVNEWDIRVDNTLKVINSLNKVDLAKYKIDGKGVNLKQLSKSYWLGCRRFILKDMSTIVTARVNYFL